MSPSLDGAAHFTHGDAAGEAVRRAGAHTIVVRRDLLTVGPCHADPEQHRRLRVAHWQIANDAEGLLGAADLAAAMARLPADQPIVLWATTAWSDQLSLWWALDGVARSEVERDRLWWAEPRAYHPLASAGGATTVELQAALENARPISPTLVSQGAELWQKYASPSPLELDEARRAGRSEFPRLAATAEMHGGWFPRRDDDGQLRLAFLDERLLSQLGDDWRSLAQMVERDPRGMEALMLPFGDHFVLTRLNAWSDARVPVAAPLAAIEKRDHTYRLGERARRLLSHGAASVAELPPIDVGGCRLNDPATPWARIADADGWRIVGKMI